MGVFPEGTHGTPTIEVPVLILAIIVAAVDWFCYRLELSGGQITTEVLNKR